MSIRKKIIITIAIIILTFIIAVIALAIFIKNYVKVIYKENSADGSIQVVVQTSDNFRPAMMGGQEYTIIVYENSGLFRNKLLDKNFWYINDGANLVESQIDIKWLDNSVKITIKSQEGYDKIFTCDF